MTQEALPRIGVFVCHCGSNIGGYLDVPSVAQYAHSLPGVVHAEDNLYTCSQDTKDRIREQIDNDIAMALRNDGGDIEFGRLALAVGAYRVRVGAGWQGQGASRARVGIDRQGVATGIAKPVRGCMAQRAPGADPLIQF